MWFDTKRKKYFTKNVVIKNESEIITDDGEILRPDRIVFDGDKATIIDYKTGKENETYGKQLNYYANAIEKMGFEVENKIIAYINKDIYIQYV